MTDFPDFTARWIHALEMNGVSNAQFAKLLDEHGQNGQSNIRIWKDRGKVGARSVRLVSSLLPKTNMDWLQYGEGSPERFSGDAEPSPQYDDRQSYAARLSPATIRTVHEMLRWRFDYEGQRYDIEAEPELFSLAFQAALSGSPIDKASLKVAVDEALHRGKQANERRDEAPAPGAGSDTPKRSGRSG